MMVAMLDRWHAERDTRRLCVAPIASQPRGGKVDDAVGGQLAFLDSTARLLQLQYSCTRGL